MYQSETSFDEESTLPKEQADESLKDQEETNDTSKADTTMECVDANSKEIPHGISFNEIPGTPIVDNSKGSFINLINLKNLILYYISF